MSVFLLLGLIWAVVLVPPAVRSHAARKKAFMVSFGPGPGQEPEPPEPALTRSAAVARRRRIAGGLLIAMVATLVGGLLPTFRVLLIVHLFLVDSFIAYIAVLVRSADRAARASAPERGPRRAGRAGAAAPGQRGPRPLRAPPVLVTPG
jgi:predicted lipid-binding transport protein (Tim44 family)